jgi:two-component system phosphate regulon sensor histidine kinase PhoR
MRGWRIFFPLFVAVTLGAAGVLAYFGVQSAADADRVAVESVRANNARLVDEKIDRVERKLIDTENVLLDLMSGVDGNTFRQRWDDYVGPSPFVRSVFLLGPEGEIIAWVSSRQGSARGEFFQLFRSRVLPDLGLGRWPPGMLKHLHARYEGHFSLFAYQTRLLRGLPLTTVLEIDQDNIVGDIFPKTFDSLRGEIHFAVYDQDGSLVYGASFPEDEPFTDGGRFPTTLYRWTLRLSPARAEALSAAIAARAVWRDRLLLFSAIILLVGVLGVGYTAIQAQRLAALKTEFVSNVSHELKTPLSLIRMFAELLRFGPARDEKKTREYVTIIHRESERLAMLIENVLDFARHERRERLVFSPLDLGETVSKAAESLRPRIEQEGHRLVVEVAPGLMIRGDGAAITRAVQNLIDNAAKFSERGCEVRVVCSSQEGEAWLSVADTGPGIPPEDLPRVFERFYRGQRRGGRLVRGSGIGLSLVREIARQHGGRAEAESRLGAGSRFTLFFPLMSPEEGA